MDDNKPEERGNKPNDEPPMFYMENGFMVFTREYHLKRGYCCQNGCRHCPYGFKKEQTQ
jgi:hypothetical protein